MPHKKQGPQELDVEHIQGKILLIEQGLPIDISETELASLEEILRGARSFYLDMLIDLHDRRLVGGDQEETDHHIVEESKNLAGVEIALRKIDIFREHHKKHIKEA